jgi:GDPmannose 4,6-dehydratase
LFNHESALRPVKFVTRKIISAAVRISLGADELLYLGDLSIKRDWGFAPEYVEAMWRMLQQDRPLDLIISTGESHTLQDFVALSFKSVGLEWKKYVVTEGVELRPSDARENHGSPSEAKMILDWESSYNIDELVERLIKDEIDYQGANIKI